MTERGLSVDHSTIARWVLRYAPVLNERLRRHVRRPAGSWRVDETYIRVNGRWTYLYRAVDSAGATIDFLLSPKRDAVAAKLFLQLALRSGARIHPRVINVDGHQSYAQAITELRRDGELGRRCRSRRCRYLNNVVTAANGSDHVMPLPGLCRVLRRLVLPACFLKIPDAA
jgi:transposase-like protein